jgi:hypothetical protein
MIVVATCNYAHTKCCCCDDISFPFSCCVIHKKIISELCNRLGFNPVAPPFDCHFDFQVVTDCFYNLVQPLSSKATPDTIEDVFVSSM